MRKRRFVQCDVFAATPAKGNGLAVIFDAEGLSDTRMQEIAAWTNLAETCFLLAPDDPKADYRVRIFTPGREMPFAGHPTLGSCAAWLHAGNRPADASVVIQECAIGLVKIDLSGKVPAFVAPRTTIRPMAKAERQRILNALDLDASCITQCIELDNGPVWQVFELNDARAVLDVDARRVSWPEFVGVSLLGPHPEGSEIDFEVRNISSSSGMIEDPITGSLNAAIAEWMRQDGRLTRDIVMAQGTCIGREGRVFVHQRQDSVLIGGHAQVVIEGTILV